MKKWLFLLATAMISSSAGAQANAPDWSAVKNIPAGTEVWVKANGGNVSGTFLSADDSQISIEPYRRKSIFSRRPVMTLIPRTQVREVRFAHRVLSAATGAAIGVGLGTAAGLALESRYPNHTEDGHLAAAVFGVLGGLFGEIIGEHTGFIHGARIYRAP